MSQTGPQCCHRQDITFVTHTCFRGTLLCLLHFDSLMVSENNATDTGMHTNAWPAWQAFKMIKCSFLLGKNAQHHFCAGLSYV